jgi:septal ring factor EnvC (AmiA/AmiB activator)
VARLSGLTGATRAVAAAGAVLSCVVVVAPLEAQEPDLDREIRQSQLRLEQIREERERLEREIGDYRNRVRNTSEELANIERRLSASRSVLAEVEFQSETTAEQIQITTRDLLRTRENLAASQAILHRRLRDIYKMGPAHATEVLLSATSFTDLLNRYRYLQRIAAFDRSLVRRVRALEGELVEQNDELQDRMALLGTLRQDRLSEVAELRSVEEEHQRSIQQYRAREQSATSRIEELAEDETRMTTLLEELEARRIELERRRRAAGATLRPEDAGTLDWPVEGELVYRFGPNRRPDGTVIRWNGIGIAAPPGTPVRAVRDGTVAYAGPFEGYGPTVILGHGDGFYTLYMYLEEIGVVEGRSVTAGQVVGTVGGSETPEGPHLEFQIRTPAGDGTPAQDPLVWLRPQGTP